MSSLVELLNLPVRGDITHIASYTSTRTLALTLDSRTLALTLDSRTLTLPLTLASGLSLVLESKPNSSSSSGV